MLQQASQEKSFTVAPILDYAPWLAIFNDRRGQFQLGNCAPTTSLAKGPRRVSSSAEAGTNHPFCTANQGHQARPKSTLRLDTNKIS